MTRGLGGHSPANMSHNLRGVDFPAKQSDLARGAKENGAEQAVMEIVDRLPKREYDNMADVMKAYGEVDADSRS